MIHLLPTLLHSLRQMPQSLQQAHHWVEGQVLRGSVMQVQGSQVQVNIQGQSLWAYSQAPLSPQTRVWLQVEALTPAIRLKVLHVERGREEAGLRTIARQTGIQHPRLLPLIQAAVREGLPLHTPTLRQLVHLQGGRYFHLQGLRAASLLQARGLPLHSALMEPLYRSMGQAQSPGAMIHQLLQALSRHPGRWPQMQQLLPILEQWASQGKVSQEARQLLPALLRLSRSAAASGGEPVAQAARVVADWAAAQLILQLPVISPPWLLWQFPASWWLPDGRGWVHVAYARDANSPERGKILFQLEMPRLKSFWVELVWVEKWLQFTFHYQEQMPQWEAEFSRLKQALEEMGYTVGSVEWKKKEEATPLPALLPEGVDQWI